MSLYWSRGDCTLTVERNGNTIWLHSRAGANSVTLGFNYEDAAKLAQELMSLANQADEWENHTLEKGGILMELPSWKKEDL